MWTWPGCTARPTSPRSSSGWNPRQLIMEEPAHQQPRPHTPHWSSLSAMVMVTSRSMVNSAATSGSAPLPRPVPRPPPGPCQPGHVRLTDPGNRSPCGRFRRHCTKQLALIAQRRQMRQRVPTIGDHHREVGQDPARCVPTRQAPCRCRAPGHGSAPPPGPGRRGVRPTRHSRVTARRAGGSWRAGQAVLKPSQDERVVRWLSDLLTRLEGRDDFRVSPPRGEKLPRSRPQRDTATIPGCAHRSVGGRGPAGVGRIAAAASCRAGRCRTGAGDGATTRRRA